MLNWLLITGLISNQLIGMQFGNQLIAEQLTDWYYNWYVTNGLIGID